MTDQNLFTPYTLGALTLSNRVVLAPLTRNRAGEGFVPSEFAATYYSQRASAGLLISEATQISQQGQGYQDTPGIYTQAQIDGWRKVTDAVHAKGGKIFLQLWHVGRVSHVDLQENGAAPVAPSALRAATKYSSTTALKTSPSRAHWTSANYRGSSPISAGPRQTLSPPGSMAWRFTAQTAICWINSSRTAPTCAPMLTAVRLKIVRVCCSK